MRTMNKIYMITGANRGIGLGLAKLALQKGFQVLATSREQNGGPDLMALKREFPTTLSLHLLDVSVEKSVQDCFASLREKGVERIDVLVNNSGTYGQNQEKFLKLSLSMMIQTFQVNTLGPIRVLQEALPFLQKSPAGKMVAITSKMGSLQDNRGGGSYDYRMSKAALNMCFKNLSLEFPDMVSLLLHPGWVKTRMGGPHALITVEESAAGLLRVIEKATLDDSGKYLDYSGLQIPW